MHSTAEEAIQNTETFSKIYGNFLEKVLLIPTIHGFKSVAERFAGAENTLTFETLLPDGQFLQLATAHALGQNFARVFKLLYLDQQNKLTHP
ncbi:MAG: hypothetical protein QJQ54_03250 [Mollicutes bacterium]|nr:MAG: hypothetical protein QJQ54_03250 [Mollicutes bacterium]